jgi:hypothetical protein
MDPKIQADIQVLDSTNDPYIRAAALKNAKNPKQISN